MRYLRIILWLACLAASPGAGGWWGQIQGQNLGGGLSLGFNASQVDGDGVGGFRQVGLSLGGFVYYDLSDRLRFQPEVLFDQLGSRDRGGFFSLRTQHITVPLLLSLQVPVDLGNGLHDIHFEAGPALGVLLMGRDNYTGADYSATYRNPDLRVLGGFGYDLSARWAFHLRYGYSAISFLRTGNRPIYLRPDAPGLYHHYVTFSLRYHLSR